VQQLAHALHAQVVHVHAPHPPHQRVGSGDRARGRRPVAGQELYLRLRGEPGKILVSHSTWALVQDVVLAVPRGEITVKGFQNPVQVYEVVGSKEQPASQMGPRSCDSPATHHRGRRHTWSGR